MSELMRRVGFSARFRIAGLTDHLRNKIENEERTIERKANEERKLRNKLGDIGAVGHYFGPDSRDTRGEMEAKELEKILQLLSHGEKRINLKEREFRAFLNEKNG